MAEAAFLTLLQAELAMFPPLSTLNMMCRRVYAVFGRILRKQEFPLPGASLRGAIAAIRSPRWA